MRELENIANQKKLVKEELNEIDIEDLNDKSIEKTIEKSIKSETTPTFKSDSRHYDDSNSHNNS